MSFIPVTNITGFSPTQLKVGQEMELTAIVNPPNATNKTIEWSVGGKNVGHSNETYTTRYSGTRCYITAHQSAVITVRATIRNGQQQ